MGGADDDGMSIRGCEVEAWNEKRMEPESRRLSLVVVVVGIALAGSLEALKSAPCSVTGNSFVTTVRSSMQPEDTSSTDTHRLSV